MFDSIKFTRAAYNLEVKGRKMRVKVQGVIRASGRGVPKCVKQEAMKTKAAQEAARGTTKLAVLHGDPKSKDIIIGSCYD